MIFENIDENVLTHFINCQNKLINTSISSLSSVFSNRLNRKSVVTNGQI